MLTKSGGMVNYKRNPKQPQTLKELHEDKELKLRLQLMILYYYNMLTNISKTTVLTGISGKEYKFSLYTFDDFEDLKDISNEKAALYLFTRRHYKIDKYVHDYLYLGETKDISKRYNAHHKERDLKEKKSNCIGFYFNVPTDEEGRKALEKDILENNNFPLNDMNN